MKMCNQIDDVSKAQFDFVQWKPIDDCNKKPLIGLGDAVAVAIHALTGIKPCAKCERRKRWLNKKFPFRFKSGKRTKK